MKCHFAVFYGTVRDNRSPCYTFSSREKDAIVSKFCGLSCGELINEAAFQADVRFMMFNSMLV